MVCKLFRDSATSDVIYQAMDINRLKFHPFSVDMDEVICRCRKSNNTHILFNDGMSLQDAADKGQLDAIFVLAMFLMAEGSERKQEALIMLNNAYINTRRSWNMKQTCYKVRSHLVRGRRSKHIQFHVLHKSCAKHPSVSSYGKAFMHEYSWLFNYDIFCGMHVWLSLLRCLTLV
uniref:Uncharacterized protein n=1 Tax=Lactuca sativa TaxID=4236 RepID=A0A9R1W071_LACSA|nr:hypothetical protein LSAT_V11C400167640 [Lactuca sativa]